MFTDKKILLLSLFISSFILFNNTYAEDKTVIPATNKYQFNYDSNKLPDFNAYKPTSEKKTAFFNYMSHYAKIANDEVLAERKNLKKIQSQYLNKHSLSKNNSRWLMNLTNKYKIKHWNISSSNDWKALLARVDIVPSSMLLAQAANESAWGTSRFATKGNNLFGQWCFTPGCGIVPKQRAAGNTYEVQAFPSVLASVQAYILNLNTNSSYQSFRDERAQLRTTNKPVSGYILASGLEQYSQQKEAYVVAIRHIITANQLAQYPSVS